MGGKIADGGRERESLEKDVIEERRRAGVMKGKNEGAGGVAATAEEDEVVVVGSFLPCRRLLLLLLSRGRRRRRHRSIVIFIDWIPGDQQPLLPRSFFIRGFLARAPRTVKFHATSNVSGV